MEVSTLGSHQMPVPGQLRTKIRAESSSNGSSRPGPHNSSTQNISGFLGRPLQLPRRLAGLGALFLVSRRVGLLFFLFVGHGFWWRISSLFSLPTSISVLALTVCAFRNRVGTLPPGVQVHWPDWWTPVGATNHEKSFCLSFHRILSLGCAVRVKLLFPLQGVVRRSGSNSRGCVWFGSPCFPVSTCFPSGCPVWAEVTGSLFLLCLSRVLMRRGLFHPLLDEGLV